MYKEQEMRSNVELMIFSIHQKLKGYWNHLRRIDFFVSVFSPIYGFVGLLQKERISNGQLIITDSSKRN
jgi:hypothetical protein